MSVPKGLSMNEAACIPETFMTVWHNVFERGALKPGESFLVHGGSGGIGTTAIQLAAHFGARVFTTEGSDEKCTFCESIVADRAINFKTKSFATEIKSLTDKRGVDAILDMVGGDYIQHLVLCRGWPHRADRVSERLQRAAGSHARHAETLDPDRIDIAPEKARVQGPPCPRA
jgi:NADPH:quinone reductase